MKAKVYVEGGGDSAALRSECRRAFAKLFEKAGLAGRLPKVVACGGRGAAYDNFCISLRNLGPDEFPILLVDSENAVAALPWQHLKTRDDWDRPDAAEDDQVHLMVQCMEAWFLADREQLARYFGQGFRENALPENLQIEEIPTKHVLDSLAAASRDAKTFLQHQPYKSGGVFLDVSPCISRGGRVLASETWCHATSIWSLTIR